MVAPTMKMLLVKTKRREQAPALRYEIDFSAKVAEMRKSVSLYLFFKRFNEFAHSLYGLSYMVYGVCVRYTRKSLAAFAEGGTGNDSASLLIEESFAEFFG